MPSNAFRYCFIVLCSALFLFKTSVAHAQTETKEIYLRILEVEKKNKDTVYASVDGGAKIGVQLGSIGSIIAGNDNSDRRLTEIGFASIIRVTDSFAILLIRPKVEAAKDSNYVTRKGDYIKLDIEVPKLAYHSVFFDMALLNIQFTNIDRKELYTLDYLLKNDSKKLEDSILSSCTADIQDTYNRVKDRTDTIFNVYKVPLTEGRYKGRSLFNVLATCTNKDVYAFINYAKNKTNDYLGNTLQVTVKFADWVYINAPFSSKEVYDTIIAYKSNPLLLKQFIQKNREVLIKNQFVKEWILEAMDASDGNNESKYNNMMEVAKLALPHLQDDYSYGLYFYAVANYFQTKAKYLQSIAASDSAIQYFDKSNAIYISVISHYSKAYNYRQLLKPDIAIAAYEKGFAWMQKNASLLTGLQIQKLSARYYKGLGFASQDKEDYRKATENFVKAIDIYKSIGDYENINAAISLQKDLAKIYKKQSELNKAYQIYAEQLVLYRSLNDTKNEADALDNIAEVQFNLAQYRNSIDDYTKARDIYLGFKNTYNAGYSQSNIGQAYWNLGKYDSAITSHQKAIEYRKQANNFGGLGYSWKQLGELFKKTGEKTKALAAYDSSANYYSLAKDSSSLKNLLNDVGDVYYNDKQYQKAFNYYYQVHIINVSKKNKLDLTNSFFQLGNTSYYYNIDSSKKYFTSCYMLAKEIGDKSNELFAGINLGNLSYKEYDYVKGESYFTSALNVAKSEKNKSQEANCYKSIANANLGKLDFGKAITYYQKAITIYDSLGEKASIPEMYRNIGNTLYSKGDFNEAKKWFQKSIEFATNINSRAEAGYSYNSIVFLYTIQGELTKAEAAADSAYNIFKDLDNSWQMANTYFNKGVVAEARSSNIKAFNYYSMADSIYLTEKDDYSHSTCQTNLGCIFYYQADFDKALKYFFEADKMLSTIKTVTEGHILAPINIGEAYYYKKDYAKAEPYLLQGYKMAIEKKIGRMQTISSSFLGTLYYDIKKYALSEKYLLEGFALAEKSNETDLYINSGMYLGKLYALQNQPTKSQEYYRKTINFIKTIDNSKYTWMALYEYGLNFYNNKNYDSASFYFKQAVVIVENSSQNLFGGAEAKKIYNADERKVDLYNKLVASLAKIGKKEEALYYADKSNSQAVKEQMEKAGLVTNDKEKEVAIKKGSELLQKQNAVDQAITKEKAKPENEQNKELIASLESIQKIAQKDYINYINGLVKKYPDMQAYFSKTNPVDFKNNMKYIPDSTLAVLYIINENQLYIFTATKQEIGIKTIELKKDINRQAEKFLGVLKNPANVTGTGALRLQRSTIKSDDGIKGDFKTEASVLYDMLITPILDQLKDKKNICIIPNSKLSNIPFQALGSIGSDGQFHFLVEDYAIFYTNKMDIFSKPFESQNISSSFIALGNPDKSLPNASVEVNNFSKIIKNAAIFTENAATENKATEGLSNYKYVHFATHGVLDYAEFEKSYLVFAPEKGSISDGRLTIEKINGLSISNCRLVTLSACETAVSKESVKGWYISPANSFLQNNVGSVIASLWKVDDEATSVLMDEFYKNLSSMSMTQALRMAQETLSKDARYSHPYFWSAFVLYGEWR